MDHSSEPTSSLPEEPPTQMSQPSVPTLPPTQGDESAPKQSGKLDESQVKEPSDPVKAKDSMDTLVLELEEAVSRPEAMVKRGRAPVPFFFGFEPSAESSDQRQAFVGLLGMSAFIRMFAAMNITMARKARSQTKTYSITKPEEYVAAFNEGTDAIVAAVTEGPLAGIYNSSDGGFTKNESQLLKRSDIHHFVLSRIFGGLSQVGKEQMKDLNGVLTHFVTLLKPFEVTATTDQPMLKHVILINYIRATDITGDNDVFAIDAYTRMVIVNISAEDWSLALKKPSFLHRNELIKISMTTTTVDLKLDEAKYQANKARYEQALKLTVDGQPDLKEIIDNGGVEAFGRKTCTVRPACEDESTSGKLSD